MGSGALTIVHPGDGERIVHQGWEATIKLGAEDTGGAFAMIETRFDAGEGPDAHVHSRESETWMVLEGTVEFQLGDARVELGPGGIAHGPAHTAHAFTAGLSGARLLHVFQPAGMEGFFRPPRTERSSVALRRKYGVETVRP